MDGNIKMTLGMIWTIILRFAIQDISVEGTFMYLNLQCSATAEQLTEHPAAVLVFHTNCERKVSESLVFYIHVHVWVEGALGENEIDPHTFTGDWAKIKKKKKLNDSGTLFMISLT